MKYKLKEICDYVTEQILTSEIDTHNYISTENMLPEKLGIVEISTLPNTKKVRSFKKGDILISNIRPYFKKIWCANFDGGCSADVLVFRVNSNHVDSRYLFELLSQDTFFDYVMHTSKGTKMPRGDKKAIMEFEFELVNESGRKYVSNLGERLSFKIQNNNKVIGTLEEMASTLFKHWFVDFEFPDENNNPYKSSGGKMVESKLGEIPEGMETGTLDEIATIKSGKRPVNKVNEKTINFNIPIIGASKIMGYTNEALVNEPIITTGRVGTHGVVHRFNESIWVSDNSFIIRSNFEEYTYQVLNKINYSSLNRGSTQPLITQTDLKNIPIIIPTETLINKFESICKTFTKLIKNKTNEKDSLNNLRDTLLPKLLSGEIELPIKEEV